VEWHLDRISPDENPPQAADALPGPAETPIEHDLRLSVEMANAKRAGLEPEPQSIAEETPSFAPPGNGHGNNGNGSGLKLVPNGSSVSVT
jgi:hypothetical protein